MRCAQDNALNTRQNIGTCGNSQLAARLISSAPSEVDIRDLGIQAVTRPHPLWDSENALHTTIQAKLWLLNW